MSSLLDEACALLAEFEKDIADVQASWKELAELNPDFEQVSSENWQEKHHRMWLHGATETYECNELERWLTDYPPSTKTANLPAQDVHDDWQDWLEIAGPTKVDKVHVYDKKSRGYVERELKEPSEAYYADHDKFTIQAPREEETLLNFIVRLVRSHEGAYDEHKKHELKDPKLGYWLEERALDSFLDFVRKQNPSEEVAFIEHIFPQKRKMHYGHIIRLIPPEAFPIPEKMAAEILIELARRCRSGHPFARHTAIESLALSWVCIACSRIRLPKTLKTVRSLQSRAILSGAEFGISKNPTFGSKEFWRPLRDEDFSVLLVPTWFGEQPLKMSNRVAAFLKIVARFPSKKTRVSIFRKSRKSLDQTFHAAVRAISTNPEHGNITYSSLLMHQPHIHGNHRPQPKY